MIVTIIVNDDFSVNLYKNDELFLYMKRKSRWGKLIGKIYNTKDKLLIKVESFLWLGTKITYQNLDTAFSKIGCYLYDRFTLGKKDKIEFFYFLIYYRIYWNNKFIADTKVIYTLKHNLKLELHFNIDDDEQIYYTCIFFCITCLYMR